MDSKMQKISAKNITFEITNECNLKCSACPMWQEAERKNLGKDAILGVLTSGILRHPLESVTLTGGEPFMHPEFNEIFKSLVLLKMKKQLRKIGISSNGYDTARILDFLKENKDYARDISLFISLDGFGSVHDKLRGRNNAFEKTMNTINAVNSEFEDVNLTLKFTICSENANEIPKVYDFCSKIGINLLFKLLQSSNSAHGLTPKYRNSSRQDFMKKMLDNKSREKIAKELLRIIASEKNSGASIVNLDYLSALVDYLQGELEIKSCKTPENYLFIDCTGNIYPCLYQEPIANCLDKDWEKEFYKKRYAEMINNAEKGICPKCLAYHGYLKYWNFKNGN
ncbi:MAG: radical SAM protein [archaeon]